MHFYIISLYPEFFRPFTDSGVIAHALEQGVITITVENLRDYAIDRHGTVDDTPYGGDGGMVLRPEPIFAAYRHIMESIDSATMRILTIVTTPRGRLLTQAVASDIQSKYDGVIIICGAFTGVDERIIELLGAEEISIGDYVLSSGELPAMIIVNAVARLVPGVLGNSDSAKFDSFSRRDDRLGPPVYTRPAEFKGLNVPEVLLSGDHQRIKDWKEAKALEKTESNRPRLLGER